MFKTVKEITDRIVALENAAGLFDWQVEDVYVWEIIRYKIYLKVVLSNEPAVEKNKQPAAARVAGWLYKAAAKLKQYTSALLRHPFLDQGRADVLIFESSRKTLADGRYIDPFTSFTASELLREGKTIRTYQSSYRFDRLARRSLAIKHLDLPYLTASLRSRWMSCTLSAADLEKTRQLEAILHREFKLQFHLEEMIREEIRTFKSNALFFKKLFARRQPKEIYLVNFCDKPALIAMAKAKGIVVTDIQHGLISDCDIIYHYPNVREGSLRYFPDRFYAWSDVWKGICSIPLASAHIINYGNRFLQSRLSRYAQVIKNEKQLLVISQPGLTRQIAAKLLEHMASLDRHDILYKLHPNEYVLAGQVPEYEQLRAFKNIRFVGKEEDLFQLMASSRDVAGVYSTALIEAMEFKCRILLFDLPGVEMMAPFVDHKQVRSFSAANTVY